ncbi:MAG: S9 family peptidase [Candidatus Aminicenantaceae bacterium]
MTIKAKKILSLAPILAIFLSVTLFSQGKKPMTFLDTINLKRVSDPSLSPDGTQILYTVTNADWEENRTISHIWRLNIDGEGLVQMTNGKDGESGGTWSPDGTIISFITERNEEINEENQIFFLNNSGGEAIEFSSHKGGVLEHTWSPCGKKIYFTARDALSEEEEQKKEDKDDAFLFEKDEKNTHLWQIDVQTKKEKKLTDSDFTVREFQVSRDGTKILFSAAPSPNYDDALNSEIWLLNLEDGSKIRMTDNNIWESRFSLSPDNTQILFVADTNEKFEHYYQDALFLVPATGGIPKLLLPGFKYEIYEAFWSADGETIYFGANMGVHVEIFALELTSKKVKQLTNGKHVISGFDYIPKINSVTYSVNTPYNPTTFWITDMDDFNPRMIYDPYTELENYKMANVEAIQWKSTDGQVVEGVLFYPVDYEKGKRYPLLAHTHGGPQSSDKLVFDSYAHARAGRGYAILKPNYRGSTGYGNDVLRDMVGHYFLHADDDVITGVEHCIKIGLADPDRLGTLGWSAGGHMTNWLITQTDIFKAASSGAGASNWISMYAQSDVRIYRTPWFLGDPWHADSPLKTYREHSPIFYVHQAKTPTLILYGENDRRVPLPQGYEMYRGLKANGVPTELVIFPRAGHGPRELRHRLYKMNKEFQWLEKYIMDRDFKFEDPPVTKKKDKNQ